MLSEEVAPKVSSMFATLEENLKRHLPEGTEYEVKRTFDGRLLGQSWDTPFVTVPNGELGPQELGQMITAFHDEYQARYGNRFEGFPVEGVTYRVEVVVTSDKVEYPKIEKGEAVEVPPVRTVQLSYMDDANSTAGEYVRGDLKAGNIVRGPAIIREPMSTTHVIAGQVATIGEYGEILIERA